LSLNPHGRLFTLFLAGLSVLPPLAIDMALPSLAYVEADLHATQAKAAAAIAIFLAGFATAPILVGPLADRFGRKPVMLAGLALFALCGAGCALAPSILTLLAFRLVQGAGAGAVGVLPRAIIRDLFEGREARLSLAAVSLMFSVGPLIAPTLGAAVLALGSWRAIYALLAAIGTALAFVAFTSFEESHEPVKRRNLKPKTIIAGYRRALTHPLCAGFALINGFVFAGLFSYVNTSPLIFMQAYGFSKAAFAGLFAIGASGVFIGSSINAWLLNRHAKPKSVIDAGLTMLCLSALALTAVSLAGVASALIVAAIIMIYVSAFGLVFPNASHEAVHPLPEIAGVVSAVLAATQMLFGALGGAISAAIYHGGAPLSLGLVMSVSALAAAALYALWLRAMVEE
jgi:MFS transporter, DHA1 family, multidrug resistance protein